jgi:penicillin amidase
MRYFKLLFSTIALIGFIYLLSNPVGPLPAIGNLLNPHSGFWQNAESNSTHDIELQHESLIDEVEILYDDRHVPHIYAQNLEDLIFAQGYAIARERLWQMDITTRSIEGTTAEVLGTSTIEQDKKARQRGLERAARKAIESWQKSERGYHLLERFSAGVNFYIDQLDEASYPLEFKLLAYKPQYWEPYRTSLFIKAMALTLNAGNIDIPSTNALKALGSEKFNDLYPDKNKKQSPIIENVKWAPPSITFDDFEIGEHNEIIRTSERSEHESFIGSNNFALSGVKTASGNPILANDPHLKLTLPSIWLEMHLVCPEMNVYGVSLPGMPGITLGFNEYISWGQTNVGQDVLDIYEIAWVDESKKQYYLDGEVIDTEVKIETFKVKGEEDVIDTVLYTIWGPIKKENGVQTNYAQRWVSLDTPLPTETDVYLGINQSKNLSDFKKALKSFTTPAQNFIFSSNNGDIAMIVTGKFPVKAEQQGRFVQDGSTIKSAWKGFIPFDELPQQVNPERGFVASANQHSTDETYPYYYNGGFEDYRGRYINRRLSEMQSATRSDLMDLQLDAYSLKAEEALPLLLSKVNEIDLSPKEKEVKQALEEWDFVYDADDVRASYFDVLWATFYKMTFDEIFQLRDSIDVPYPEPFRLIEMMEEDTLHWVFDRVETPEVEDFGSVVNASFHSIGFDTLTIEPWGDRRNTTIDHLTNIPAFSINGIVSGGEGSTPNAITRHTGPSWRMVVEMDEKIKGYGIYPGGQSGNPGSMYFETFVEDWAAGNYYELNNSRNKNDVKATQTLKIKKGI